MPSPSFVRSTVNSATLSAMILAGLAGTILAPATLAAQDGAGRVIALKVGTVHPVSGPAIENGVILMRDGRIMGVGRADQVNIPNSAVVEDLPNAHAYPGLVDALSSAFASAKERTNGATNAGTDFLDALDPSDAASRKLIRYGITTAYVSNRSGATWRGLGAIVRPNSRGFSQFRDQTHGGLGLRMTTGNRAGHALDRLKQFDTTGNVFDALEAYEQQQKDYAKALADYEKQRQTYLEFHKSKKEFAPTGNGAQGRPAGDRGPANRDASGRGAGGRGGARGRGAGDRGGSDGRGGGRRGNRGGTGGQGTGGRGTGGRGSGGRGRGGRGGAGDDAARRGSPSPGGAAAPDQPGAGGSKDASKSDAASEPKKPEWPKKVAKDDAKETLLKVVNGELPLRIEAHRADEIRAALFMALIKELPEIILEYASEGGDLARDIAAAGAPVVVSDLLPGTADPDGPDPGALPAALHRAGVSLAIGSGSLENARNLTLMAAYACGRGLPEEAAIRALTLTPAEMLGVADHVGSLQRNKVADVLITSGPLLRSDTRILRVIAQGETQFQAEK